MDAKARALIFLEPARQLRVISPPQKCGKVGEGIKPALPVELSRR